jgi:hypothetical protein
LDLLGFPLFCVEEQAISAMRAVCDARNSATAFVLEPFVLDPFVLKAFVLEPFDPESLTP